LKTFPAAERTPQASYFGILKSFDQNDANHPTSLETSRNVIVPGIWQQRQDIMNGIAY
jgi:hypothetical protein